MGLKNKEQYKPLFRPVSIFCSLATLDVISQRRAQGNEKNKSNQLNFRVNQLILQAEDTVYQHFLSSLCLYLLNSDIL